MKLLHGTALESWKRYKDLDQRLQHVTDPSEQKQLRNSANAALQQFRRAYIEQHVRRSV